MSTISYEKVTPAIYDGKASRLYAVKDDETVLIIERKDDITAGNGAKHDVIPGKGVLCNQISNILFRLIDEKASQAITHLYDGRNPERFGEISECETAVAKVDQVKLEVVVRNIATGSIIKRLPFNDGQKLDGPIIEFYYKDDKFNDPLINESEAVALGVVNLDECEEIVECALEANDILQEFFARCGITLVDIKLEFGIDDDDCVLITDEASPDTMRLWDTETGRKLDKDLYREGGSLEDVLAAYQEVYDRIKKAWEERNGD